MNTVDARGRSCPEPVILTKNALAKSGAPLKVLVDNPVPVENITRFVTNAGYSIQTTAVGDEFELLIQKV